MTGKHQPIRLRVPMPEEDTVRWSALKAMQWGEDVTLYRQNGKLYVTPVRAWERDRDADLRDAEYLWTIDAGMF